MAGATLFFARLTFATLFVFRVQAGWETSPQDYAVQNDIERRQARCTGLVALGGDGATHTTSSGVLYTLYCGIVPLPVFYNARSGDASIVNCLSSCDIDPECGASYLINEICYYSEAPTSYEFADDPETILALRAASPNPYPDQSSSSSTETSTSTSSSVEVPPIYPVTT